MINRLDDFDHSDFFNEFEKPSSPKLEKKNSLPSWLAETDTVLNKFKIEYDTFKKGHDQLTQNLKHFNEKQNEAR